MFDSISTIPRVSPTFGHYHTSFPLSRRHLPTNPEHNTRRLVRRNQYQKNMVDHVDGKIPRRLIPTRRWSIQYLIRTTVLHQLQVPSCHCPLDLARKQASAHP